MSTAVRQTGRTEKAPPKGFTKVNAVKFIPRNKAIKAAGFFEKKYASVFKKLAE
jgi:hypothetical protein